MHPKDTIHQDGKDWEYQIAYQRGIEAMVWAGAGGIADIARPTAGGRRHRT